MSASRPPCPCHVTHIDPFLLPLYPSSSLNMTTMSSDTMVGSEINFPSNRNGKAQEHLVPEIPSHWIFDRDGHLSNHSYFCWGPPIHCLYHLLCVISFGHASLYQVWESTYPDCPVEVWEHGRDMLRERIQHINIVVRFSQRLDRLPADSDCISRLRLVCSLLH